ncbi:MAG: hypothetical protein AAF739_17735 [Pseudomonadota bacterium]
MRATIVGLILLLSASPAGALNSQTLASELARIIVFEDVCGFSYDRAAISRVVRAAVSPQDLSFNGLFNFMRGVHERDIEGLSPSARTVLCTQIEQIARDLTFIE